MQNKKAEVLLWTTNKAPNGLWVEIGGIRESKEVPQDGYSTYYLAKEAERRQCDFITIDKDLECSKIALKLLNLNNLPGKVINGDGKIEVAKLPPISFLYLDSHRLPIFSAEQYIAAELVPGAVIAIDDCHEFDGFKFGKGTNLVSIFEHQNITWSIADTEPGFKMIVAYFPEGKTK